MYLPRFAQAGVLRHPHLGTALARSSRVYAVQNQLRQLSLAAKPRFSIRSADGLSRATFQQVRFATDAADGEKKVTKAQARQEETERKRKERASRKEEELTEKLRKAEERVESRKVKAEQREQKQEKENKKREQQKRKKRRDELQELKKAALQRPKYLPQSWYSVAVALKSSELSKSDFPGQDFFTVVHAAVKSFTPEEIEVCEPLRSICISENNRSLTQRASNSKPKPRRIAWPIRQPSMHGSSRTARWKS